LCQRDDFGHRAFAASFPALDNLLPEISDMRDTAAEGGATEAKEDEQDLYAGSAC
jgi:hypothetical protein